MSRLSFFAFILFTVLVLFQTSYADPVILTSGSVYPRGNAATSSDPEMIPTSIDFRFEGDNFSASGGNGGRPPLGYISTCFANCIEGSTISPLAFLSSGTDAHSGRVTYLGNEYSVRQASFNFTGSTTTLGPLLPIAPGEYFSQTFINLPFSMSGTLDLRSVSGTVPNLMLAIAANGNVNLNYVLSNSESDLDYFDTDLGKAFLGRVEFIFSAPSPSPEPVPEPATIILLAGGLLGIGGFSFRRKKQT